jgi:GMP synthase (glutamine-hydrolysing)
MIYIVDFGSQTAHLIGRRLNDLGCDYQLIDPEETINLVNQNKPIVKGIILSGGPDSVYAEGAPTIDQQVFELGVPVLGICYGWQLTADLLGGEVKSSGKEYGPENIKVAKDSPLLAGIEVNSTVWMSHGDSVVELPKDFEIIASTNNTKNAAVANRTKNIYGLQFHPEAEHTEQGKVILKNFLKICAIETTANKVDAEAMLSDIKEKVGTKKVICAVSGGVDSSVAAFLIGKAISRNLIPVYVESGLMRPGTQEKVEYIFKDLIDSDLIVVKAEERFLKILAGVEDPETKRKAIGKLYVEIFQEIANEHPEANFLGQGTIRSDVIESKGSKKASNIKSHHNVGGLPKDMELKLIEPLRDLYKDQVRQLGNELGLPQEIVNTQPHPGPGYAVRIRGEVNQKRLEQVKIADDIVVEEMKNAKLYDNVFQCFAVMTGAFSTANKGDARVFAEVVAIRAYESKDIMSSTWAKIPYDVLQKMSSRIVNEVPDVSRVVYDITTKPPATMEWE